MAIIAWLFVGGVAGWVTNATMETEPPRLRFLNLVGGTVGAVLGGVLWRPLTHDPARAGVSNVGSWILALAGASLVLLLLHVCTIRRR